MSSPFLAEIRMFGFNFAPVGWAFCNGAILPISQYAALFSLLGTNFGGNGTSNFGLPNLQGNVAIDFGQGAGLSQYFIGQTGGTPTVTLLQQNLPIHNHTVAVEFTGLGTDSNVPGPTMLLAKSTPDTYGTMPGTVTMSAGTLSPQFGGQAHNNMMPYLAVNFCIAMQGIFPARN